MAQLVARAVWDREVEGSSPFTPTKKRPVRLGRFFLTLGEDGLRTFDPNFAQQKNQRFNAMNESGENTVGIFFGERTEDLPAMSFFTPIKALTTTCE